MGTGLRLRQRTEGAAQSLEPTRARVARRKSAVSGRARDARFFDDDGRLDRGAVFARRPDEEHAVARAATPAAATAARAAAPAVTATPAGARAPERRRAADAARA